MMDMCKLGGYTGRILRVDLTNRSIRTESTKEKYVEQFVGGRGLAARILLDEIPAKIDPLGQRNKLVFMTGPLVGTGVPGTSRFIVATKSPETGIYTYNVAGGRFGLALKQSGFDGVIVEGESKEPTSILIDDGKAELKEAISIWGTPTFETIRLLKGAIGNGFAIAAIGPAGEKQVKMAALITDDRRAAARGGPGAVMGSKKLKAIAARGHQKVSIANRTGFSASLKQVISAIKRQPGPWKEFPETGTQSGVRKNDAWGILPTRNWQEAVFEGAPKISHPSLREKYVISDTGCVGCPIKCTKVALVQEGKYSGSLTDGPEYETLYALGSACGIDSPEAIIAADMLCDNLGLDTISTGVTIAWAMECFEKGIMDREFADGVKLSFGQEDAMIETIRRIAYKEGALGELLAEGSRKAAGRMGKGSLKYAMQSKGLELGGYDPRGSRGMAIVFACGPRGGCHHSYGIPAFLEIPQGTALQSEGKGSLVYETAILRILFDSSPLCTFYASAAPLPTLTALVASVTGIDLTVDRFKEIAQRTMIIERVFNAREGLSAKDDTLPERLLTERLPSGPNKGQIVTKEELELMKREFYEAANLDSTTGLPTASTLESLGLFDIADQATSDVRARIRIEE